MLTISTQSDIIVIHIPNKEIIMIITFCGHSNFVKTAEHEKRLINFFEEKIGENPAEMYLGGYGGFDDFAYSCCKKYKEKNPNISLVFITPYMTLEYQKNRLEYKKTKYDYIVYPEIEDKPLKFAITYRNRFMVEKADFIVAYVAHTYSGAYQTYKYAKGKGKEIFNLAEFK